MKYAIIKDGVCVNIIVASAEYAEKIGAVLLSDGFGIGDLYNNDTWVHSELVSNPDVPEDEIEKRLTAVENDVADLSAAVERGLLL